MEENTKGERLKRQVLTWGSCWYSCPGSLQRGLFWSPRWCGWLCCPSMVSYQTLPHSSAGVKRKWREKSHYCPPSDESSNRSKLPLLSPDYKPKPQTLLVSFHNKELAENGFIWSVVCYLWKISLVSTVTVAHITSPRTAEWRWSPVVPGSQCITQERLAHFCM